MNHNSTPTSPSAPLTSTSKATANIHKVLIPLSLMQTGSGTREDKSDPPRTTLLSVLDVRDRDKQTSRVPYNQSSQWGGGWWVGWRWWRWGAISLFLLFLVFFPRSNHHYLDKLLTLPEKLNYINNSTMKILSPSEKLTAANKNLPDFHQATWARTIVVYVCAVLPELLSSALSLAPLYMCICMYILVSLCCFCLQNILIYVFP